MGEYKVVLEILNENSNEILNKLFLVGGPILTIIIQAAIQGISNLIKNKKENKMNKVKEIEYQLKSFYYPIVELLRRNEILYSIFIDKKDSNFRTLVELIKGTEFDKNDKALLWEILEINKQINDLIVKNMDIIKEDKNLSAEINKASVHFTLMELAYNKKISGDSDRFKDHVYPRELQEKIEEKIKKLNKEIN